MLKRKQERELEIERECVYLNMCETYIEIRSLEVGSKNVDKLESNIHKWVAPTTNEETQNSYRYGERDLRNVVLNSGIGTIDTGKETDLECRGSLLSLERFFSSANKNQQIESISEDLADMDIIALRTETEGVPRLGMWVKLISRDLPNAALVYRASEYNTSLFVTNDETLIGKYVVVVSNEENEYLGMLGVESVEECKTTEVVDMLQRLLGTSETNVDNLLSLLENSEYAPDLQIYQWEYRSEYDF